MDAVKASHAETGEFMGFAGWHTPKHTTTDFINLFRRSCVEDCRFAKPEGWSEAEVEEMWKDIDVQSWEEEFGTYDRVRKEEMNGKAHW